MSPGNNAAQDALAVLFVAFAIGVVLGIGLEKLRSWRSRRTWSGPHRGTRQWGERSPSLTPARWTPSRYLPPAKLADAADQLRIVIGADFESQPLLNRSEVRVFDELSHAVFVCNPTWHVMAQVSLGEILRSKDAEAYRSINSKRVDLLLVDGECQPRHAIEYQGGGHHQGTAAVRDAVKKEALRRAGIGYHEVIAGFTTPAELRRLVAKLVDVPDAPPGA